MTIRIRIFNSFFLRKFECSTSQRRQEATLLSRPPCCYVLTSESDDAYESGRLPFQSFRQVCICPFFAVSSSGRTQVPGSARRSEVLLRSRWHDARVSLTRLLRASARACVVFPNLLVATVFVFFSAISNGQEFWHVQPAT